MEGLHSPCHGHPEAQNLEAEELDEVAALKNELAAAQAELENIKAIAVVSENTKEEAIDFVNRKCQEEVASLQVIMKDSIQNYSSQLTKAEKENMELRNLVELKERENSQLKMLLTKSGSTDNLEAEMKKAEEDANKLRSIVVPMEEEIAVLKDKLKKAHKLLEQFRTTEACSESFHSSTESVELEFSSNFTAEQSEGSLLSSSQQRKNCESSSRQSPPSDVASVNSTDTSVTTDEHDFGADFFAKNSDTVSIKSFTTGSPYLPKKLTADQEETASLVSTGTLVPECIYIPPAGYQLVRDNDWNNLQQELKHHQSSTVQLQEQLEVVTKEKEKLEDELRRSSDECAKQVDILLSQIERSENLLQELQTTFSQTQQKTQQQLAELASLHKRLSYDVQRLTSENEGLKGQQNLQLTLQETEEFKLPTSVPELQKLVQQYRKDLLSIRATSEHQEERLRIEIVNLQEQLQSEQCAKQNIEDMMNLNMDNYKEELEVLDARLSTLKTETDRIQQERKRHTYDNILRILSLIDIVNRDSREALLIALDIEKVDTLKWDYLFKAFDFPSHFITLIKNLYKNNLVYDELKLEEALKELEEARSALADHEKLIKEEKDVKRNLEVQLSEERSRIHRLQEELNTSEQVQREFVQLSQTLQVRLEKIRQADSLEVVQNIMDEAKVRNVTELKDT
ncbi:rab GTPase-binding effector protein 2 [Protopterus annectens]|uniref:rab GTPase-binding effector protein 2 n=1 Tax=Protopterus annectens TaxID=7888 RepID=UPI001CFC0C4B|nr:rab GTPase-binding effector protein 2 [Protopterus annectens]